jgi:K+-sensing histidine kinase KdpD
MEPLMSTVTTTNSIQEATECAAGRLGQQHSEQGNQTVKPPQIENILVAVDFSDYSEASLRYATFLAENFGATLTLVHSVEPYVIQKICRLDSRLRKLTSVGCRSRKKNSRL